MAIITGTIAKTALGTLGNFLKNQGGNLISGMFGLGSGSMGYAASARAAEEQFNRQLVLQQLQHKYNKETMQNAHQWEVADLKKAGLNPILSAGGNTSQLGAGLGTPSMQDTSSIQNGFNTALAVKQNIAQTENMQAQTNLINQETTTEGLKQSGIILDQIRKEIENEALPKQIKMELKKLEAEIEGITTNTAVNIMKKEEIKSLINLNNATAKYTNERARGYSESDSQTYGGNIGAKIKDKKGIVDVGGNIGGNYSKSKSRTW